MSIDNLGRGDGIGLAATAWIGGLVHELGHGMNLPHCGEMASEAASTELGASLMGKGNTGYWHSAWSTYVSPHPHHVVIDLKTALEIAGVSFWQRQGTGADKPKAITIKISPDRVAWEALFSTDLKQFTGRQNISLPTKCTSRYLKFTVLSSYGASEKTSLAEIGLYR